MITTSLWQRVYWKDDHLKWNASKYDGLDKITLSAGRIWKPDISLINDVSGDFHANRLDYPATVFSNGTVRWLTPGLLASSCTMDMTYFPWDEQTCTLQFTTWTHDTGEIVLSMPNAEADTTEYAENGEWQLVAIPARTRTYLAICCPVPFTNVEFDIRIRRRARYYVTNLIFPSVLITASGMLVFCLPPESGEKVSLSVTILLATTVYQLVLAERMPVQSLSTPVIGCYFMMTQVLLALSTTLTVLVLDIHHQGIFGHSVPQSLQKIVKVMAILLCFKGAANRVWRSGSVDKESSGSVKRGKNTNEDGKRIKALSNNLPSSAENKQDPSNSGDRRFSATKDTSMARPDLENSAREETGSVLPGVQETLSAKEAEGRRMMEWRIVAKMFDRLFLIVFGVCFLVSSVALLSG